MERLFPGSQITGIPGATWNEFCDTKKQVDQLTRTTNQLGSRGTIALRVQVENTTDDDITSDFPVLELGDPIVKSSDRENCVHEGIQFEGKEPDDDTTRFAIVQGQIPKDAFRPAVFIGYTWCRVNVTDNAHKKAKPTDSTDYLASGTSGALIVWREKQDEEEDEDKLGEQYAVILLGAGGGGGVANIAFGIVTVEASIATSLATEDRGGGKFKPVTAGGVGDEQDFINISADPYKVGQLFPYITNDDGDPIALPPWCNLMSLPG